MNSEQMVTTLTGSLGVLTVTEWGQGAERVANDAFCGMDCVVRYVTGDRVQRFPNFLAEGGEPENHDLTDAEVSEILEIQDALNDHINESFVHWQDESERTKTDVVQVFKETIDFLSDYDHTDYTEEMQLAGGYAF